LTDPTAVLVRAPVGEGGAAEVGALPAGGRLIADLDRAVGEHGVAQSDQLLVAGDLERHLDG
jgi:hypothetical protein